MWVKRNKAALVSHGKVRAYLQTEMHSAADSGTPAAVNLADCLRVRIVNAAA